MSATECDNVLAKLIDTIVNHEKQIEDIKVELAGNQQFSPFSIFRRINTSGTGFLDEEDLNAFFRHYGFLPSKTDLKRLLTQEKQNSSRLTYNDFLNQTLPSSDIDLRNEVLERGENRFTDLSEPISRDIGRLITAVYQKEVEYLRALEVDKKRLLKYDVALIDVAFFCLSDDISTFLNYKSISTFMKHNGFHYGKDEHECFMRRIDKAGKGRVSVTDLKYRLFPFKSLTEAYAHLYGHNQQSSIIEGISPIKSLKGSPVNKNNVSIDSRNQKASATKKAPGDSILRKSKNGFSPMKQHDSDNPDVKIPAMKGKNSHQASQVTFNDDRDGGYLSGRSSGHHFNPHQNKNIYEAEHYMPASSRHGFYNQEIATIQDRLAYQNVPGSGIPELDARNPLENRFLDPKYHSYWGYSKQHNATLSPEYLNIGHYNLKAKKPPSAYYNPNFLEPGSYENTLRYPDNPFKYTDHGHYFQSYYNGLRSNYYDEYYHYVPYKAKVTMSRAQSSASKSRNSPAKSYTDQNEAQFRSDYYQQPNEGLYQSQPIPEQQEMKNSRDYRASSVGVKSSNYSDPHYQNNTMPEYKVFSQAQARPQQTEDQHANNRSAIKIDSQGLQQNSESLIDSFLIKNQPNVDDKSHNLEDDGGDDERPYKYVVVHS